MKKRSQLIITGIAIALMAQMTTDAALTLLNGDIANKGDAVLSPGETEADWTAAAANKINSYFFSAAKHEGLYGMEIRVHTSTDSQVYQFLGTTVSGESDITFSAYFKNPTGLAHSTDMTFGLYSDAAGTSPLEEQTIVISDTFTQYSVNAKNVAVGTDVYVVFTYRDNPAVSQNKAFVDTMVLTIVKEPSLSLIVVGTK